MKMNERKSSNYYPLNGDKMESWQSFCFVSQFSVQLYTNEAYQFGGMSMQLNILQHRVQSTEVRYLEWILNTMEKSN